MNKAKPKNWNVVIKWIMRLILGIVIAIFVLNIVADCKDWANWPEYLVITIPQVLTLVVAVIIAFWATQFKNDQRKKKEHAEELIEKVQNMIGKESFTKVDLSADKEIIKKEINIAIRKLSNYLTLVEDYANDLGFKDESDYMKKEFKDYKEFVSEHLEDLDYLNKSETTLQKYAENINSKCDYIIRKLYC